VIWLTALGLNPFLLAVLNLKWSQIDLKERTITFEQVAKTKKVPFIIWINDRMYELLLNLKSARGLIKVVGPYVFEKKDGKPYKSIQKVWHTCSQKAEVKGGPPFHSAL